MPSDKRNSITAKATGLIFSLFDVASSQQVPFGIYHSTYNAFFMDLPVSSFVSHSSLLTAKSVNFVIARDGFPSHNGNRPFFHSGYFDSRGACQTVLDSYCCVMGWTQPTTKRNEYFTFHTIINITEARGIISFGMRLGAQRCFSNRS